MALCVVLAVSSNVLLVYALQSGDLSVLGPINAYKAVISLGLGVILIGEIPTLAGLAGVLLILAGSYFVLDRSDGTAHDWRGIRFRLAALVLSATEAVFLKRAILAANPVTTFLCWSILGLPVAALAAAILLRGRVLADVARFRRHRSTYAWLAITTGVMQLTTLLTFGTLQVGYALSLFQLSALLSVLLGHRYFQERDLKKRLLGSTIMIAGAILIVVHGRG
jgi:drug/metabolite transporter (DMT)-like permease